MVPATAANRFPDLLKSKSSFILTKEEIDFNSKFSFCFIRNPFDRLVSCWINRITYLNKIANKELEKVSFSEFIKKIKEIPDSKADEHFRSQTWFMKKNDEFIFDFIGRVEYIEDDWKIVSDKIGIQYTEIPHIKKSRKDSGEYNKHFQNNKNLINIVKKRFEEDFELLDYKY